MVLFSRFYYLVVFRGTCESTPFCLKFAHTFVTRYFDYFIINITFTHTILGGYD